MKQAIKREPNFSSYTVCSKPTTTSIVIVNKAWLRLSFPWFYGYTILRGLDVLAKSGYNNDERLSDAVEYLLKKQGYDGKWVLENAPMGRMQANIETVGQPSRWITLIAFRVLKMY